MAHVMPLFPTEQKEGCLTFELFHCCMTPKYRRVALSDAPMMLWHAAPIASVTVVIECANTRVVQSVLRVLPAFVSPMAVVGVVPSRGVTRVLGTSSSVLHMVAESVVDLMVVTSQLWVVLVCVLLTAVVDVVSLMVAISQLNRPRDSVSNTGGGRNVHIQTVRKLHVGVLTFAQR
jgi:hypothetical protein